MNWGQKTKKEWGLWGAHMGPHVGPDFLARARAGRRGLREKV